MRNMAQTVNRKEMERYVGVMDSWDFQFVVRTTQDALKTTLVNVHEMNTAYRAEIEIRHASSGRSFTDGNTGICPRAIKLVPIE